MHDQVMKLTADLSSGLMVPLREHSSSKPKTRKRRTVQPSAKMTSSATSPAIPQLDGDADDDDEKGDAKDEDDENAINSDLDDSDDEGANAMGDDDDDMGDSILCTYDKVQRVKNKWKCTLKDGVMSVGGKEWVFHKGMGEFEW
jgi:transcription initiation factor TFIIA large subunit